MDPEKIAALLTIAPLIVYGVGTAYYSALENKKADAKIRALTKEVYSNAKIQNKYIVFKANKF